MKYKVYYNGSHTTITNSGKYKVYSPIKTKHIWPEDNTQINFSVNGDIVSYTISNLSDRTQYLLNNNLLGLGLFIHENDVYISNKWRSDLSKQNHLHRRCVYIIKITSLTGTINLNTAGGWLYQFAGSLSRALYHIFWLSSDYQDPYRPDGYEHITLGVGRFPRHNDLCNFRPHKVAEEIEIEVQNTYQ